jgi:hypothetical protein
VAWSLRIAFGAVEVALLAWAESAPIISITHRQKNSGEGCAQIGCGTRPRASAAQIYGMSLPRAYLAKKLTQPLPIRGGVCLRTIGEAANYVLELPQAESANRWSGAAELLRDQADVAAVSKQVKLALFYDAQLDIGAMD